MKHATITIPDDMEKALELYLYDQEVPLAFTTVMQSALRGYLAERGYLTPARPLRITPAKRGSSQHDVSVSHDRYLVNV